MAAYRDPRAEAVEYLEKHNLFRLFDILASKLVYVKPADPDAFLVAELTRVASLRTSGQPVGWREFNLNSMGIFIHAWYVFNCLCWVQHENVCWEIKFCLFVCLFQVTLFTEQDISAMFAVFDITNRGYLTQAQYLKGYITFFSPYFPLHFPNLSLFSALNAVGVKSPVLETPTGDIIDKKTFVAYMWVSINFIITSFSLHFFPFFFR